MLSTEPVQIVSKPHPDYTDRARRAGLEGEVILEVTFPVTGHCRVLRIVKGLGYGLDESAVSAAERIEFHPALQVDPATQARSPLETVSIVRMLFQLAGPMPSAN